jgi:organic hydroperoxide reductase OsmC/OhrA
LESSAEGDVELDDGVLILKRIRVNYHLRCPTSQRAAAERAHSGHEQACPVSRSLEGGIAVSTTLTIQADED